MTDTTKLEALIKRYEGAIFGDATTEEVDELSCVVEDEARRIGYDNHARLHSLHTMAEMFG
jgi:hypothetical protein